MLRKVTFAAMALLIIVGGPTVADFAPSPGHVLIKNDMTTSGTGCIGGVYAEYGLRLSDSALQLNFHPTPSCSVEVRYLDRTQNNVMDLSVLFPIYGWHRATTWHATQGYQESYLFGTFHPATGANGCPAPTGGEAITEHPGATASGPTVHYEYSAPQVCKSVRYASTVSGGGAQFTFKIGRTSSGNPLCDPIEGNANDFRCYWSGGAGETVSADSGQLIGTVASGGTTIQLAIPGRT